MNITKDMVTLLPGNSIVLKQMHIGMLHTPAVELGETVLIDEEGCLFRGYTLLHICAVGSREIYQSSYQTSSKSGHCDQISGSLRLLLER